MTDEGKLFIGGLCFDTNEDCLKDSFSKYGPVLKADVVRDRETHRSRGFGFVTFQNPQDAKDAKAAMDGKCVDGKQIRVDEAGKPSGRSGGSFRGQGSRGSGFYRGPRRGDGVGYGQRYGERPYGDKGYGDGYRREGFGGGRSYGDEDRSYAGYRSGTSRGGGSGYNPAYSRDNRSQGSYGGEQRSASYRDDYDSYDNYG